MTWHDLTWIYLRSLQWLFWLSSLNLPSQIFLLFWLKLIFSFLSCSRSWWIWSLPETLSTSWEYTQHFWEETNADTGRNMWNSIQTVILILVLIQAPWRFKDNKYIYFQYSLFASLSYLCTDLELNMINFYFIILKYYVWRNYLPIPSQINL